MIYVILWIIGIPLAAFIIGYFDPKCDPVKGFVASFLWPGVAVVILAAAFVALPNHLGCWLKERRK